MNKHIYIYIYIYICELLKLSRNALVDNFLPTPSLLIPYDNAVVCIVNPQTQQIVLKLGCLGMAHAVPAHDLSGSLGMAHAVAAVCFVQCRRQQQQSSCIQKDHSPRLILSLRHPYAFPTDSPRLGGISRGVMSLQGKL